MLLLAPLCANMLASVALGLCNNLLSSMVRAWYYDLQLEFAGPLKAKFGEHALEKQIIVAPGE